MDHDKLWNILRNVNTRPHYLPSEKPACRTGSNSQNWTWNNRLLQNWERSMSRLYITCLFDELDESQAGIKIARKYINNLRYADDTTLMAEREELKNFLMKVKKKSEKACLKLNIQKLRSWHLVPSLHGKQMGRNCKQ